MGALENAILEFDARMNNDERLERSIQRQNKLLAVVARKYKGVKPAELLAGWIEWSCKQVAYISENSPVAI